MTWGKVDDKLWGSPKWLATGPRARALWVSALSWSMDQLTDGHVPDHVIPILGGNRRDAGDLVRSGLWEVHETDGWVFHDWTDYQPARSQVLTERKAAADRQKRARDKAKAKRDGNVTRDVGRDYDRDSRRESRPPRPDPTLKTNSPSDVGESPVTREDEPPMLETSVPRHVLGPEWVPGMAARSYAAERGIDLSHELRQFRLHCKSKRTTSLDWDAEFERWLGNARIPGTGGSAKSGTGDRVHAHADLARRLAAEESNVIDFPQLTEGGS